MRIFIVSGEVSGDQLGAHLALGLKQESPDITLAGWGGQQMADAGVEILADMNAQALIGFAISPSAFIRFYRLLFQCRKDIKRFAPHKIILIDFGGFNMQLAKWAHARRIPVIYYVPPKVWASRGYRLKSLKSQTDLIIVHFPFEYDYLISRGLNHVRYYGHPLAEKVSSHMPDPIFNKRHGLDKRPLVALLPGSRKGEISKHLPILLELAEKNKQYNWCVGCAPNIDDEFYEKYFSESSARIARSRAVYDLMSTASCAVIASGTASLEAALFDVPHVVIYRTGRLNYMLGKWLIQVKYLSLVNLVLGQLIVEELIQDQLSVSSLTRAFEALQQPRIRSGQKTAFNSIRQSLENPHASRQAALAIIETKSRFI